MQEELGQLEETCFLAEGIDADAQPTHDQIMERALQMDMDPQQDQAYFYLAKQSLVSAIPPEWKPLQTSKGEQYYVNIITRLAYKDHPLDIITQHAFDRIKNRPYKRFPCYSLDSVSKKLTRMVEQERVRLGFLDEQREKELEVIRETTQRDINYSESGDISDFQRNVAMWSAGRDSQIRLPTKREETARQPTKQDIIAQVEAYFEEEIKAELKDMQESLQKQNNQHEDQLNQQAGLSLEKLKSENQNLLRIKKLQIQALEAQLHQQSQRSLANLSQQAAAEATITVNEHIEMQLQQQKRKTKQRINLVKAQFEADYQRVRSRPTDLVLSQLKLKQARRKMIQSKRNLLIARINQQARQCFLARTDALKSNLLEKVQKDLNSRDIPSNKSNKNLFGDTKFDLARQKLMRLQERYDTLTNPTATNSFSPVPEITYFQTSRPTSTVTQGSWQTCGVRYHPRLSSKLIKKIF